MFAILDLFATDTEVMDSAYVNRLNRKAEAFRFTHIDSLIFYADRAYETAKALGYVPGKVEAIRIKIMGNISTSTYKDILPILFNQKLELNDSIYLRERAIIDNALGTAFSISGNYRAGLPYFIQAAEVFRELDDLEQLLVNLNNTGVCYIRLQMFGPALAIYNEIEKDFPLTKAMRTTLAVNYGYCYYGLEQYEKGKKILKEFLLLPLEEVNERGHGFAHFKLGEIYIQDDSLDRAEAAFNKSIEIFERFNDKVGLTEPLLGFANLCLLKGNYELARQYAQWALDAASNTGILQFQSQALEILYTISKSRENPAQALEFFEQLKSVSDSLNEAQNSQEIGQLTAEYLFNQQKNELLLAQKEQEVSNNRVIAITTVLLIVAVVLLLTVYRQRRRKEIWAKKMEDVNNHLEREVKRRTSELRTALEDMETFAYSASHDLKSPVRNISILSELVSKDENDRLSEDAKEKLTMIKNSVKLMLDLIEGIKDYTKINNIPPMTDTFDISNIIDQETRIIEADARAKVAVQNNCKGLIVKGNQTLATIVFRNLIGNAVQHNVKEEKMVSVSYERSNGVYIFHVEDNGPGIPEKRRERAFRLFETLGTNTSSGLGLAITKKVINKIDGEIWISNSSLGGARVSFTWSAET